MWRHTNRTCGGYLGGLVGEKVSRTLPAQLYEGGHKRSVRIGEHTGITLWRDRGAFVYQVDACVEWHDRCNPGGRGMHIRKNKYKHRKTSLHTHSRYNLQSNGMC